MIVDSKTLDRRAYGQARRYLGNKRWQHAQFPAGAGSTNAMPIIRRADQIEDSTSSGEEDMTFHNPKEVYTLEAIAAIAEGPEQIKVVMDGRRTCEDVGSQGQHPLVIFDI